jgi:hypothetical protein
MTRPRLVAEHAHCDMCHQLVPRLAVLQPVADEYAEVFICAQCLRDALRLVTEEV